jgi:hypothetical protein
MGEDLLAYPDVQFPIRYHFVRYDFQFCSFQFPAVLLCQVISEAMNLSSSTIALPF